MMRVDPELALHKRAPGEARPGTTPSNEEVLTPTGESPPPTYVDVFQKLINGLPEQIALVDDEWNILAVNSAWSKTAALYGYSALQPGTNYLDFCRAMAAKGHTPAGLTAAGIEQLEADGNDSFRFSYHGKGRWEGHAFQLCINRIEISGRQLATVTRYDVTELVKLRHLREDISTNVLEGQMQERRRIGREIHDSTMQLLASLGLAIGLLKRTRRVNLKSEIIADMEHLLMETQQEIRALSYLSHPPLLDKQGLAAVLQALAEGYGRRTGLKVTLHIEGDIKVGWQAAELAMYRVVQEALSNVHRHANATQIFVGLYSRRSMIHLVVADNGTGIPSLVAPGVGLASMRERLSALGGRLAIRRGGPGTEIIASLPLNPMIRAVGDLSSRA